MTRSLLSLRPVFGAVLAAALLLTAPALAQEPPPEAAGEIALESGEPADAAIARRIETIFDQIENLSALDVEVEAGVVTLTGETLTAEAAQRAEALAGRVEGVVTVENQIERDVSVTTRVAPAVGALEAQITDLVRVLPLIGLALGVFLVIAVLGWLLSRLHTLWRAITPNRFVADLVSTSVFALSLVLGLVSALSLLDAAAFLGALLGAAGVIGLAVGFAVRDTIENYIASIMLSVRQPFRPNDHVVIETHEGRVIRLTSRATILMTLDGNHLRIPNATVFKAVIVNYTRNPERRFDFVLGLDPDEDALAALETGIESLGALDFVLADPAPIGTIQDLGASTIDLYFAAWIDQNKADFAKSRSVAIAAVKAALEEAGFVLPDPSYRVHLEGAVPEGLPAGARRNAKRAHPGEPEAAPDVTPDLAIARRVDEERREGDGPDLLSEQAPTE